EMRNSAEAILAQTERISTIVRTLIDFSRSDDNSDHRQVRLANAVNDAIQLLRLDKTAKPVNFVSQIPADLMVHGDTHQLTQVFVNLLANARFASPEHSEILVYHEISASG